MVRLSDSKLRAPCSVETNLRALGLGGCSQFPLPLGPVLRGMLVSQSQPLADIHRNNALALSESTDNSASSWEWLSLCPDNSCCNAGMEAHLDAASQELNFSITSLQGFQTHHTDLGHSCEGGF